MSGIVVVGSINVDLILRCGRIPRPGETLGAHGRAWAPGGKGANQAVASARLGAPVVMVGAVGDDDEARTALHLLEGAGVDMAHVRQTSGATGLAVIYVDETGENSILVEPGANAEVTAAVVRDARAVVADADVLVVQGEIPPASTEAAVVLTAGRVVFNLAPVVPVDVTVLRRADPLVVNEHEGLLALGLLTSHHETGSAPLLSDEAVVAGLLVRGVPSVVMTRGAAGALVGDAAGVTSVSSPRVDAVDTTGAGDAFVGALAWRLLRGDDLRDAAAVAVRVAAFACIGRGAQPSYPWAGDDLPG